MKLALGLLALPLAGAFTPTATKRALTLTKLSMEVVTGREGKAANSAEEDLLLTMKIILDHAERSTTVSKEQFISQMQQIQKEPESEPVDLSIPYDAAAKLAYEASDKSMAYGDFKTKYEADAVAYVIAKRPIDLSVPYDAAAKLAYEASDKSMGYGDFKTKYEADAVAYVIAKKKPNAVAEVTGKAPFDLSVPYDAAAKLAYEGSDKSMAYGDFKSKFEADAVAYVIAKQRVLC
jgi:hypothetical protein